ncbi:DUF4153 domain-containing protein [Asticcacaulis benevestitus]|uniref:DUF4153 domain-containing protein n=1 Tax=Asticcacaulis benevestitus DSM 16100 = ATCC BAA-896 TaxID=1121022 RepID=V4PZK9_9CAUL|nr:DUF4153 domain-containing protein [Asticcacaulis benevestitus]ESQ93821.1 hypothetical protein ABENE_03820 [Asticcacaulis benevestitus DSM 16100 = ATCC BAA-896]
MTNQQLRPNEALIVRLATGLVFGLAIAWLIKSFDALEGRSIPLWAQVLTSTLMLGAFILWAGAGAMKRLSLAIWSVIALGLIALIAWNRVAHANEGGYNPFFFNLSFLIYPFLFITHELVSSADQSGTPIAPYGLYFDEAWKRGVQLALSVIFTALFWGILWLGAVLLGYIGFSWFKDLLSNEYFSWPISGLAIAASVNLGDVQTKLMHNFRALVLGVLSWLLPVITVIGLLFAVSLCFSGLEPLWKTKAATASLLTACVALVLLINAAYQQGDAERPVHIVLRWSARLACGLLAIFAGLAAYSLYLRIAQYGLTPERVMALVGVVIALLYGLGYAVAAALPRGRWLNPLEPVNIALAFVMAAICFVVLTPIADPYRLSAQSQAERVNSGAVIPEKFDWRVLRFETGSYGLDELKRLSKSGKTDTIRKAAVTALAVTNEDRYLITPYQPPQNRVKPDARRLKVVAPEKALLPTSFLQQDYPDEGYTPQCLTNTDRVCTVVLLDLNGDAKPEIIMRDSNALYIYAEGEKGWEMQGSPLYNSGHEEDFNAGRVTAAKPKWDDLMIGKERLRLRD